LLRVDEYKNFFFEMSDVSLCDFYQEPEYSFSPLLTLDVYLTYEYVSGLGVFFLYTDSFVKFSFIWHSALASQSG